MRLPNPAHRNGIRIHFPLRGMGSSLAAPTPRPAPREYRAGEGAHLREEPELGDQGFVDGRAAAYHAAGLLDRCPDGIEDFDFGFRGRAEAVADLDEAEDTGSVVSLASTSISMVGVLTVHL